LWLGFGLCRCVLRVIHTIVFGQFKDSNCITKFKYIKTKIWVKINMNDDLSLEKLSSLVLELKKDMSNFKKNQS
jgi:hypothetical protein